MKHLSVSSEHPSESQDKLESWKVIASWLHCDERTAKRWEKTRGLPIHRMPGELRSGVFARVSELEKWQGSWKHPERLNADSEVAPLMPSSPQNVLGEFASSSNGAAQLPGSKAFLQNQREHVWLLWVAIVVAVVGVAAEAPSFLKGSRAAIPSESSSLAHTPPPEAEELYFRGRYYWNLRTADSLDNALDFYTQAIVKDPQYAEAYSGLAETYDLLPQFGRAELASSLAKAEDAANRAIALNPNLADAHAAKAFALYYGDWDIADSDAEFQRALALDPRSARTHHWYASTLHDRNEKFASLRQIDEAIHLDPTSASIATDAAFFQADFGNMEAGIKSLKEIEQTQPTLATPPDFLGAIYFATGNFPGYIAQTRRYAEIRHNPDQIALADAVARGWARDGKRGLLEERARASKVAFDHGSERGFGLGETLLLLGRKQEALTYFEADLSHHDLGVMLMPQLPWAASLESDPGYAAFFAEVRQRVHTGHNAFGKDIPVSKGLPWRP